MPSETDQAAQPQSIEERMSSVFSAQMEEEPAPVETAPEETQDQAEEPDTEETAQDQAPTVDEIEIEVEGWKGKIPAKLKAEIDKGADYTRKTQALAEERRLHEAQVRAMQEHQAFYQTASKEMTQLQQIEAQLEQYRTVDLSQIDGETLSRMSMAAANLREQRAQLKEALDQKQSQFKQQMFTQWDGLAKQAREAIVKSIPNWDQAAGEVGQWALQQGWPFEIITGYDRSSKERVGPGVIDPVFAQTLYKAAQWDKLQASKANTPNKLAKVPPVVKPGAPTGTNAALKQKALVQQHKQKGSVDTAAALLRNYFKG